MSCIVYPVSQRWVCTRKAAHGRHSAADQIQEMKEAQEVGENTRPKRAQALKDFEAKFLMANSSRR